MTSCLQLTRRAFAGAIGVLVGVGLSVRAFANAKIVLKLGHLANEENSWHKACVKFAEEVAKRTNGEIEVRVFPNEQLGKETDLIKGIQLGTVDFTITGESLQNWAPAAALLAVPYAIRDIEHLDQVVNGRVGEKIAGHRREDPNQALRLFRPRPARIVVQPPDPDAGRAQRAQTAHPQRAPVRLLLGGAGAKPTPMAFSEVFTSLQSNAIEAQENPLSLTKSGSFYEVQKYENLTDHVISWIYLAGSAKKLAG